MTRIIILDDEREALVVPRLPEEVRGYVEWAVSVEGLFDLPLDPPPDLIVLDHDLGAPTTGMDALRRLPLHWIVGAPELLLWSGNLGAAERMESYARQTGIFSKVTRRAYDDWAIEALIEFVSNHP